MKRKSLTKTLVDAAKELGFAKATVDKLEALDIPEVKDLKPGHPGKNACKSGSIRPLSKC